jgi:hypothetical protein
MTVQQRHHAKDINTSRAVVALQALEADAATPIEVLNAARQSVYRVQMGLEPDPDLGAVLQAYSRKRQEQNRFGQ